VVQQSSCSGYCGGDCAGDCAGAEQMQRCRQQGGAEVQLQVFVQSCRGADIEVLVLVK